MAKKKNFEIIQAADRARRNSYAPYSKYKVGAALLTKAGKIFTGANIENASYSLTICAERAAIFKAVSEGERQFKALAIAAGPGKKPWPCGACRQVLWELAGDIDVLIVQGRQKQIVKKKMSKLIPNPFL